MNFKSGAVMLAMLAGSLAAPKEAYAQQSVIDVAESCYRPSQKTILESLLADDSTDVKIIPFGSSVRYIHKDSDYKLGLATWIYQTRIKTAAVPQHVLLLLDRKCPLRVIDNSEMNDYLFKHPALLDRALNVLGVVAMSHIDWFVANDTTFGMSKGLVAFASKHVPVAENQNRVYTVFRHLLDSDSNHDQLITYKEVLYRSADVSLMRSWDCPIVMDPAYCR